MRDDAVGTLTAVKEHWAELFTCVPSHSARGDGDHATSLTSIHDLLDEMPHLGVARTASHASTRRLVWVDGEIRLKKKFTDAEINNNHNTHIY